MRYRKLPQGWLHLVMLGKLIFVEDPPPPPPPPIIKIPAFPQSEGHNYLAPRQEVEVLKLLINNLWL